MNSPKKEKVSSEELLEIVKQRVVPTHDGKGVSLSKGNRAYRRASIRWDNGDPKNPKQLHKSAHKLY